MSDDDLVLESKKVGAKSPTELKRKAKYLYLNLCRRKNVEGVKLIEIAYPLTQRQKRTSRYSLMTDKELIEEARKGKFESPSDLQKKQVWLYHNLRKRKNDEGTSLLEILFPYEERERKPLGYYKRMSIDDLINEAKKYDAKTPKELSRQAPALYDNLIKRKDSSGTKLIQLVYSLNEREHYPKNFYASMSDDQLISEARKLEAKNIGELRKISSGIYTQLIKRRNKENIRLIEIVFPLEERTRKPPGFYSKMSNEELVDEAKKYEAKKPNDLRKKAPQLCNVLYERKTSEGKLLIEIVYPITEREQKPHSYYKNMSNEELKLEARKYNPKSPSDLENKAPVVYRWMRKRELIDGFFPKQNSSIDTILESYVNMGSEGR